MKTHSKQERHFAGELAAAMTARQALRNLGVRDVPRNVGGMRSRQPSLPPGDSYAIRLLGHLDADLGLELESSNDARIGGGVDVSDFVNILPIEHPSVISYISSCRPDRRLIYISPQVSKLGYIPEELLDKPDLRLKQMHEKDLVRFEQALQHSCNVAAKFSCHYRLYDSTGRVRWFHDEASVVCDASGVPMFIKGVMLDVTDKKHMEAELDSHRYYLERHVEQRTELLMKRISLLESCNESLCARLSCVRMEVISLQQQLSLFAPEVDTDQVLE